MSARETYFWIAVEAGFKFDVIETENFGDGFDKGREEIGNYFRSEDSAWARVAEIKNALRKGKL